MKQRLIISILLIGVLMTGCTSVYNLTTEESDMIAEYAAGVLSKNANVNKKEYTELKAYLARKEMETEAATEAPTGSGSSNVEVVDPMNPQGTGSSSATSNMAQVLGAEDIEITCLGYEITDSYPKDAYALSATAGDGYKLVVVQYELMNPTSGSVIMDIDENVMIKAVINGSTTVKAYATLLNEDIMNMNGRELASGETISGVFIFRVREELCSSIASLNVGAYQ